MEELRTLLRGSIAGEKLLAALEPLADSDVPALVADVLRAKVQSGTGGQQERISLADATSVIEGLAFLTPRGKQDLAFFKEKFVVKTAKQDLAIPYTAIQHLAIVEWPKDSKKRVFLFFSISPDAKVMNGKQALTAVVVQTTADATLDISHPKSPGESLTGPAAVVICQAFGMHGLAGSVFCSPDGQAFKSASGGHTGVEAFVKASQGLLFPMPAGLCFLERPALFIPRSAIRSVEFARAGGGSSTFDLYVHKRDGSSQEFSNISRVEIGAFEEFVRRCKLPVGTGESSDDEEAAATGGSGGSCSSEGGEGAGSDSDDDSEDEDFNPGGSSSSDEDDSEEEGGGLDGDGSRAAGGGAGASASTAGGSKRKRPGSSGGEGGSEGGSEEGSADESADESSSEEDESSDDDGSVELVSEDEFSRGQLRSLIESEDGGPKNKKQRR